MANAFTFEDDDETPKKKSRRPSDDIEDDEDDDYTRTRPAKKKAGGPLGLISRFVSPAPFFFCIILFFLPWTDLSCASQQLLTQSGFQSATGGYSEGAALAQFKGMGKGDKLNPNELFGEGKAGAPGGKSENDLNKAILMWPYLVLLVVGLGLPVALGNMRLRGIAVSGLAGLAFATVGVQAVVGFPLSNAAADLKKQGEKAPQGMNKAGMGGMPNTPNLIVNSSFLVSFYLTALLLLGTGVFGLLQILLGGSSSSGNPRSRKKTSRKRPEDDDDE